MKRMTVTDAMVNVIACVTTIMTHSNNQPSFKPRYADGRNSKVALPPSIPPSVPLQCMASDDAEFAAASKKGDRLSQSETLKLKKWFNVIATLSLEGRKGGTNICCLRHTSTVARVDDTTSV